MVRACYLLLPELPEVSILFDCQLLIPEDPKLGENEGIVVYTVFSVIYLV